MRVPQDTEVSLIQRPDDHRWQVVLSYEDGRYYVSRQIFATEEEAKQFALHWALVTHIPDKTRPN